MKSVNYAAQKAERRKAAAINLARRVDNPVSTTVPEVLTKELPAWWGTVFFLLALLIHGIVVGVLMAFGKDGAERSGTSTAVFTVVDLPTETIAEEEPEIPEPELKVEVESVPIVAVANKPLPPKKNRRPKVIKADPVDRTPLESKPAIQNRAVIGIAMSSTVTGGSGPSYAVGNSRMGATGSIQTTQKIKSLQKGKSSGSAADNPRLIANKKATFIPTISSNFTKPKRISAVDLPYPSTLKSKGVEGNVVVLIVIDEKGTVQKVRILKSSGYREFDEAALKSARKELYRPARRDGEAVEYNLKYTYRFRMKDT